MLAGEQGSSCGKALHCSSNLAEQASGQLTAWCMCDFCQRGCRKAASCSCIAGGKNVRVCKREGWNIVETCFTAEE